MNKNKIRNKIKRLNYIARTRECSLTDLIIIENLIRRLENQLYK